MKYLVFKKSDNSFISEAILTESNEYEWKNTEFWAFYLKYKHEKAGREAEYYYVEMTELLKALF